MLLALYFSLLNAAFATTTSDYFPDECKCGEGDDNVCLENQTTTLDGDLVYETICLYNSTISVTDYDGTSGGELNITAEYVWMDIDSDILASSAGYIGVVNESGTGYGDGYGRVGDTDGGTGGGHGGDGGRGSRDNFRSNGYDSATVGSAYGVSNDTSNYMGSAGGAAEHNDNDNIGGDGGGAVRITADVFYFYGDIQSSGGSGTCTGDASGGGAGGGIVIYAGYLYTSSTTYLAASGGSGGDGSCDDGGGGGGGGRIKLFYDTWDTSGGSLSYTVSGGGAYEDAEAGDPGTYYSGVADYDGDGYTSLTTNTDCDPTDDSVYPGAADTWYDGIDSNCDGSSDYDQDGDGYDASTEISSGSDCDDTNEDIYPGVADACDGIDNNCSGYTDENNNDVPDDEDDIDNDGYVACDGWVGTDSSIIGDDDCDDEDSFTYPGAEEECDGADQDCDGGANDNDEIDNDGDGYVECSDWSGSSSIDGGDDCDDTSPVAAYTFPGAAENESADDCKKDVDDDGYGDDDPADSDVIAGQDCRDTNEDINPDAAEVCDSYDNDCDALTDGEDDSLSELSGSGVYWYLDNDGDGYGDRTEAVFGCATDDYDDQGYALDDGDCDDEDDTVYPGNTSDICDGQSNDCDVPATPNDEIDNDGDGYVECGYDGTVNWQGQTLPDVGTDCDDTDVFTFPGAAEAESTSVCMRDFDDDGYGDESVSSAAITAGNDCDDTHDSVSPAAGEVCDGVDTNCDGAIPTTETDDDTDAYVDCSYDEDTWLGDIDITGGDDCDDTLADTYPDAPEFCDGVDNDCDGLDDRDDTDILDVVYWYRDQDTDGYGDANNLVSGCDLDGTGIPDYSDEGYVDNDDDCDDEDETVYPGNTSDICDGQSNDCDVPATPNDEIDNDGDGYVECGYDGTVNWQGQTLPDVGADCDDTDVFTFPGAAEAESTSVCMRDFDDDGYGDDTVSSSAITAGNDCDDTYNSVSPAAGEVCDGVDTNCDGAIPTTETDDDTDAYVDCSYDEDTWLGDTDITGGDDCDDTVDVSYPSAPELCDGEDNDCDGLDDRIDTDILDEIYWYRDEDGDGYGDPNEVLSGCSLDGSNDLGDEGYVTNNDDCDDGDATVYPAADEVCDGQSNDCDSTATPADEVDQDGDGYVACDYDGTGAWQGATVPMVGDDCDDTDPATFPGAAASESTTDCMTDADADDYGDSYADLDDSSLPDGLARGTDCDDQQDTVNPASTEICDGVDTDCDGSNRTEEGADVETDTDGDHYVECNYDEATWLGTDTVYGGQDCDDDDVGSYPDAPEYCDGVDNDCDGVADAYDSALDSSYWYRDIDGDGFGDANEIETHCDLSLEGYVQNAKDCDDEDDSVFPFPEAGDTIADWAAIDGFVASDYGDSVFTDDAIDTFIGVYEQCDGQSNDCGSTATPIDQIDNDGDGYVDCDYDGTGAWMGDETPFIGSDCDDNDPKTYPGAAFEESAADCMTDADADGYGDWYDGVVDLADGLVVGTDCDDSLIAVNPGAIEVCDGVDTDCSRADGSDSEEATTSDTCDPDAPPAEINGVPVEELDIDGDLYVSCAYFDETTWLGSPFIFGGDDCDDRTDDADDDTTCDDAANYPGAGEICDNKDNDCDGTIDDDAGDSQTWYADTDGDGFGDANNSQVGCDESEEYSLRGYVTNALDCNDTDARVFPFPAAGETCASWSGVPGYSEDYCETSSDGTLIFSEAGVSTFLTTFEICDGQRNDCNDEANGAPTDEVDLDNDAYVECGYDGTVPWAGDTTINVGTDCAPNDPTTFPYAEEICDGQYNNCNSWNDTDDAPADESDGDGDGFVECNDGSVNWVGDPNVQVGEDCDDGAATVFPFPIQGDDCAGWASVDGFTTALCAGDTFTAEEILVFEPTFEVCDGQRNDCNRTDEGVPEDEQDVDGDAYVSCGYDGGTWAGTTPQEGIDCAPDDGYTYPGASEVCDGQYNDCNARILMDSSDGSPDDEQDLDGDGYVACGYDVAIPWMDGAAPSEGTDCNGVNATVYPGATELCDGQFNDCDDLSYDAEGAPTDETDDDGDTFIECVWYETVTWSGAEGLSLDDGLTDCDDADANTYPGAAYNDDREDCMRDADGDDWGDAAAGDPIVAGSDCDDNTTAVYPGRDEVCETDDAGDITAEVQVDNDCDGGINTEDGEPIDDGMGVVLYHDADADGYGSAEGLCDADGDGVYTEGTCYSVCVISDGFSVSANDCEDADATIHPGAAESCNDLDDDCDDQIDEGEDLDAEASGCVDVFRDVDGDGYGDEEVASCLCMSGSQIETEYQGYTWVLNNTDCYDQDSRIYPDRGVSVGDGGIATHTQWLDGHDNDCDGKIPYIELDCDNDGALAQVSAAEAPDSISKATELGLKACVSGSERTESCLGVEELSLDCDPTTGLWMVNYEETADIQAYFDGGHREYVDGRSCYGVDDCDDNCASRCADLTESCDAVDNNCSDVVFDSTDNDGIPDSMDSDVSIMGTVAAGEFDVDGDGYLTCSALDDKEVHYTDANCDDIVSDTAEEDCNNFCTYITPAAEERCNGFTDLCGGDGEGADVDDDGQNACGIWSTEDGRDLEEDVFALVYVGADVDLSTSDGSITSGAFIPLLPPRPEAPECDADLEGVLVSGDAPLLTEAELEEASESLKEDPNGEDWMEAFIDVCERRPGDGNCVVVKLLLSETADEELQSWYIPLMSNAGLLGSDCASATEADAATRPEQLVTRTVWNADRIRQSRRLVVEAECLRLYGVRCDEVTDTTPLLTAPYTPSAELDEVMEDDNRWWKEIGRYNPTAVNGVVSQCWGDPADTVHDIDTTTGGDCADQAGAISRDQPEGPDDTVRLYWDVEADCSMCLDGVDNNCDGLVDCEDPTCGACFVGQGFGCGNDTPCAEPGCSSPTTDGYKDAVFFAMFGVFGSLAALSRRRKV